MQIRVQLERDPECEALMVRSYVCVPNDRVTYDLGPHEHYVDSTTAPVDFFANYSEYTWSDGKLRKYNSLYLG